MAVKKQKRSRSSAKNHKQVGDLKVTYPGGRVARVPDDGRTLPTGTMVEWDVETPRGREMRWTVVGGGWPFDD